MPEINGIEATVQLKTVKSLKDVPVIIITAETSSESLEAAFNAGAVDYITKPIRKVELLARVRSFLQLKHEIDTRKTSEHEKEQLIDELREALAKVKLLSGFLPICCFCKKIRDDQGYWNQVEAYLTKHSDAKFSHGLCPECVQKHYAKYVTSNGE